MFFRENFDKQNNKLSIEFDVTSIDELNLVINHLGNSRSLFMDKEATLFVGKEGPIVNEMANKM